MKTAPLETAPVQPPTVIWPAPGDELPPGLRALRCPNCGSGENKTRALTVRWSTPDHPTRETQVLRCGACSAFFYNDQNPPDYAESDMLLRGRVPFYVQQGAGVSLITRPLAQVQKPAGADYMEVGCGYGFGLDFAIRTKGWHGRGIDPAGLTALGRDQLGLPMELRYLRDDDEARGTMDVVMGSEVIEHVPSPQAFVRTLRAMLKPGGVLILTTPNGDAITPSTPPGALVPLLSPGLHLVIQTNRSLQDLLDGAGFTHTWVTTDSYSLVAYASDEPLALERDYGRLRALYRDHLGRRAQTADPATDVFLAFAGRAFQESVNDNDMGAANRAWALLRPACQARFGLDLQTMTALPGETRTCTLERMSQIMPLALGGLLYARAIRRMAGGTARAMLEEAFTLSAEAAAALRRALRELAMEDGQTEDIGWASTAEAVLCAAASGKPDVVTRALALPAAPVGGAPRREAIVQRTLLELVNAGHYGLAGELADGALLRKEAWTRDGPLTETERDALYALAMLDTRVDPAGKPVGDPARALRWLSRVRGCAEPGNGLFWASLRTELDALDQLKRDPVPHVMSVLDGAGIAADNLPDDINRRLPSPSAELTAKILAAARAGGATVPEQLQGMLRSPARTQLVQCAFVAMVNAGHHGPARALADAESLRTAPFAEDSAEALSWSERDALFCLAVLDVQPGPGLAPQRARAAFARVRMGLASDAPLYAASLRGELQALDLMHGSAASRSLRARFRRLAARTLGRH